MTELRFLYPQVFRQASTREIVQSLLIAHGMSYLKSKTDRALPQLGPGLMFVLGMPTSNFPLIWAGCIADGWLVIEHKAIIFGAPNPKYIHEANDIFEGGERAVISFYRKRTRNECSCLKDLYAAVKHDPKKSQCNNCFLIVERSQLKTCSLCNLVQYCCKKCQAEDWRLEHKNTCPGNRKA